MWRGTASFARRQPSLRRVMGNRKTRQIVRLSLSDSRSHESLLLAAVLVNPYWYGVGVPTNIYNQTIFFTICVPTCTYVFWSRFDNSK